MEFVLGGLAASGACLFSNPFDVIKTRMQLQGELQRRGEHAVFYRNVFHGGWVIAKNEGIRGLQKGLGVAIFMHSIRNSTRLGTYQLLESKGYIKDGKGNTIAYKSILAGAFSGVAGAFLGSPMFLVKTQLQSQSASTIQVGTQHHHQGAIAAFKTIYGREGFFGLWRGADGMMLRALVGSPSQLTSFALTKDLLRKHQFFLDHPVCMSLVASIVGGLFQTAFMTPFDLITTRLYNQAVDSSGKGQYYSGLTDCIRKIWKTEGFWGFYKGVGANYMRLAPHGALCLVFWDILKNLHTKYLATPEQSKY